MSGIVAHYGLVSTDAVAWLIKTETGVYARIQQFLLDRAPDVMDVIGTPAIEDELKRRENPDAKIGLPMVHLKLKKTISKKDGRPVVEVTCSDDDLMMIQEWRFMSTVQRSPHVTRSPQ